MQGSKFKQIGNFYYDVDSKPLGIGGFAKVYKGYEEGNKPEPVAIKMITLQTLQEHKDFSEIFDREVDILHKIKGPYILNLKRVVKTSSGNLYIVTSLCNGGSLEARLERTGRLPENEALKILKQVCQGFVDIENLNLKNEKGEKIVVMHRDLKPGNILFHDGVTKIGDFGFAKFVESEERNQKAMHTTLGTPFYMPPEILMEKEYSAKCDIWSMGIVLYEMLTGSVPWETNSVYELIRKVKQERVKFPDYISKGCQDLIESMLKVDEAARIDWKEILKHPIVAGRSSDDGLLTKVEEVILKKVTRVRIIEDSIPQNSDQAADNTKTDQADEKIESPVQKTKQKQINGIQIISQTKEAEVKQKTDKKPKILIIEEN